MEDRIQCVKHGGIIKDTNFYNCAEDSIWSGIGRIAICKNCLRDMVDEYYEQTLDIKDTMQLICRAIDLGFDEETYNQVIDRVPKKEAKLVFTRYISQLNSLGAEHGIRTNFDKGESITAVLTAVEKESEVDEIITSEVEKLEEEILAILGYDPFDDFPETDKVQLNKTLLPFLEDENLLEDNYKLTQVIQIVIMTNDVSKINRVIAQNSRSTENLLKNSKEIESLNKIRKDTTDQINKIAKENNISNSKGGAKRATWVTMTDKLAKLDFDDAIVNFYNQKRAYGMQQASDISMKSMNEFLKFDATDAKEIIMEQRSELIEEKDKRETAEEELRLAKVEINKLKRVKDE